jgi:hypothetical protein
MFEKKDVLIKGIEECSLVFKKKSPEAEFLVEKPVTKTGLLPCFFMFSSWRIWYFGRLSCFHPGFSSLSHFLPD